MEGEVRVAKPLEKLGPLNTKPETLHRALRENREEEIKKLLVELEQRRQSGNDNSAHLLLQEEVCQDSNLQVEECLSR